MLIIEVIVFQILVTLMNYQQASCMNQNKRNRFSQGHINSKSNNSKYFRSRLNNEWLSNGLRHRLASNIVAKMRRYQTKNWSTNAYWIIDSVRSALPFPCYKIADMSSSSLKLKRNSKHHLDSSWTSKRDNFFICKSGNEEDTLEVGRDRQ